VHGPDAAAGDTEVLDALPGAQPGAGRLGAPRERARQPAGAADGHREA
jgi:hypothetical protein